MDLRLQEEECKLYIWTGYSLNILSACCKTEHRLGEHKDESDAIPVLRRLTTGLQSGIV